MNENFVYCGYSELEADEMNEKVKRCDRCYKVGYDSRIEKDTDINEKPYYIVWIRKKEIKTE